MALAARRFDGAKLRQARKEKGYSQAKLGQLIGAHVTSVSDWERGDNSPSGRHVAGLARELDVGAEHFYSDTASSDDDEETDPVAVLIAQAMRAAADAAVRRALQSNAPAAHLTASTAGASTTEVSS